MSKIFNFAIERDWLQTNPCQMIKAPAKNVQRDRLLTEDEIAKFWEATEHEQPTPRAAIGRMREARLCPPRVAPKTRRRARRSVPLLKSMDLNRRSTVAASAWPLVAHAPSRVSV